MRLVGMPAQAAIASQLYDLGRGRAYERDVYEFWFTGACRHPRSVCLRQLGRRCVKQSSWRMHSRPGLSLIECSRRRWHADRGGMQSCLGGSSNGDNRWYSVGSFVTNLSGKLTRRGCHLILVFVPIGAASLNRWTHERGRCQDHRKSHKSHV